jgi:hypothetical protein
MIQERYVLYGFGTHADVGNEVTLTQDLKTIEVLSYQQVLQLEEYCRLWSRAYIR